MNRYLIVLFLLSCGEHAIPTISEPEHTIEPPEPVVTYDEQLCRELNVQPYPRNVTPTIYVKTNGNGGGWFSDEDIETIRNGATIPHTNFRPLSGLPDTINEITGRNYNVDVLMYRDGVEQDPGAIIVEPTRAGDQRSCAHAYAADSLGRSRIVYNTGRCGIVRYGAVCQNCPSAYVNLISILKHEVGHVFGAAHSSRREHLMHAQISTDRRVWDFTEQELMCFNRVH